MKTYAFPIRVVGKIDMSAVNIDEARKKMIKFVTEKDPSEIFGEMVVEDVTYEPKEAKELDKENADK